MVALNTTSDARQPVLVLDRFSYAYAETAQWVLRDVSLKIEPGHCHLLGGATGSGKTTLLMAIRGLLPQGRQSGEIRVAPLASESAAGGPGLVLQNPGTQLLRASLGAEVAFGLENLCVEPSEMPEKVRKALKAVGLCRPMDLPVKRLSMGQQYRTSLAGVLAMEPCLVMLDEPMAQLDPRGREKTLAIIQDLKRAGRAVLVCDHRIDLLHSVADHTWRLNEAGRMVKQPAPRTTDIDSTASKPTTPPRLPSFNPNRLQSMPAHKSDDPPGCIINLNGLRFKNRQSELDLSDLAFRVSKGERIALCGPNGSGKTTLIRCLAGMVPPSDGTVAVFGKNPKAAKLRGRVSVLFQDPCMQMFEATVFEEVAFSARRNGACSDRIPQQVNSLLNQLGIAHLAGLSPHLLSYGEKHLVGLAAVLAGAPELLLLDDPFAGLDRSKTNKVMQQVAKVVAANGTTVIWTTHDPAHLNGWADKVIDLTLSKKKSPGQRPCPHISEQPISFESVSANKQPHTGAMLVACLILSMSAFAARSSLLLSGLTIINLVMLALFCQEPFGLLRKSIRFFFWQSALVVILYGFRFGIPQGMPAGFRVAWQLFLAFWPGMIFIRANSQSRIVRALSRVLPQRTAFVTATCLRFLPMLLSEMQQIREVQILRGAKILAGDLKHPRHWPDWLNCLVVPTLIKTFSLVDAIATAAMVRDFGVHSKRTAWPGD